MDSELISVIVPVYNAEKYLDRCIESIVDQTYNKIEIILVNDGSTDCSTDICNQWKSKDNRIKVINNENSGVSVARNIGLDKATGEYVTFVDSDDFLKEDFLESLYNDIKSDDYDIAISNAIIVRNNQYKKFNYIRKNIKLSSEQATKKMLEGKLFQTVCWAKLYKMSVVEKARFNEKMHIAEDLEFLRNVFCHSKSIILTNKYKYYYVIRENSIVRSHNSKMNEELDYCQELLNCLSNTNLEKSAIKHLVNININYVRTKQLTIERAKENIKKYSKYYRIFSDATIKEKIKYKLIMYFNIVI